MHDGRFESLSQCLSHYNTGISQTENLDTILKKNIAMTKQEMLDITEFLGTLRDNDF